MASPVLQALGNVRAVLFATARQMSRTRVLLSLLVVGIAVAIALLVPLPTAVQMRDWAESVGPWFPLAFLGAHIVVTVFPFPRTAFTLAAGLLFGPGLGIAIAVLASTVSALIALLLVRAAGWQLNRLVDHPKIKSVDRTLRQRGWSAVLSLRMIPAVPFSVLNYAAGASSVPAVPYTCATLIGLTPGTAAIVILGDALTGNVSPPLVLVSLCTAGLGLMGLAYEVRHHRRHGAPENAAPEAVATTDPAVATSDPAAVSNQS